MCKSIDYLKKIISIESTDPGKYEFEIEKYLKNILSEYKNLGVEIFEEDAIDKRKNLMASFSNVNAENDVILICHMDTVVAGDGWTYEPFNVTEENGKLYGRGSADMKSGLAVALTTFIDFVKAHDKNLLKRNFKVIFTVDEEANMVGVEKAIKSGWVNKDSFIMDLEPTDGTIQVSHKGRFWINLSIKGKTAHASMPDEGIDANIILSEMISSVKSEVDKLCVDDELGKTTMTVGIINGGYQPYVVPDKAFATIDFRLAPPTTRETIIDMIEKIKKQVLKKHNKAEDENIINYEITGDRAFVKKDDNSKLLNAFKESVAKLGYDDKVTFFPGYTDTAVIASTLKNINCLSYGPGSLKMAHKPNEYVEIADIERCENVYRDIIEKLVL